MDKLLAMPEEDDLAIDLVQAGHWLLEEHKFRPRYRLRSVIQTTVELLGDRYKQHNLNADFFFGVERTLGSLVLTERQRVNFLGLDLLTNRAVSRWWAEPSKAARLCARSAVVSVLRHFPAERSSGLYGIQIAELGIGMDGLVLTLNLARNIDDFKGFTVSWTQSISENMRGGHGS